MLIKPSSRSQACTLVVLHLVLEQVEKKIVEELQRLGLLGTADKPEPRMPDHADLTKLVYLSCVVKESMRLHTVSFPCQCNPAYPPFLYRQAFSASIDSEPLQYRTSLSEHTCKDVVMHDLPRAYIQH